MIDYPYHKIEISFIHFSCMFQDVFLDPFIVNTLNEFIFVKVTKDPLKLNNGFLEDYYIVSIEWKYENHIHQSLRYECLGYLKIFVLFGNRSTLSYSVFFGICDDVIVAFTIYSMDMIIQFRYIWSLFAIIA